MKILTILLEGFSVFLHYVYTQQHEFIECKCRIKQNPKSKGDCNTGQKVQSMKNLY